MDGNPATVTCCKLIQLVLVNPVAVLENTVAVHGAPLVLRSIACDHNPQRDVADARLSDMLDLCGYQ
jgi:hypothetical protein